MKLGARNQLAATVTDIKKGSVMCQVKLETTPGKMSSVMTVDSLDDLGLKVGDRVQVIVKAVHVLLARE